MNEHKICFIICVNNNLFFEECVRYIHRLEVPDGVEVELLEIKGASSMTGGIMKECITAMPSIRYICIRMLFL